MPTAKTIPESRRTTFPNIKKFSSRLECGSPTCVCRPSLKGRSQIRMGFPKKIAMDDVLVRLMMYEYFALLQIELNFIDETFATREKCLKSRHLGRVCHI